MVSAKKEKLMKVYHEYEYDLVYRKLGEKNERSTSCPSKEGIHAFIQLENFGDSPIVSYKLYEKEMVYITSEPIIIEEVK